MRAEKRERSRSATVNNGPMGKRALILDEGERSAAQDAGVPAIVAPTHHALKPPELLARAADRCQPGVIDEQVGHRDHELLHRDVLIQVIGAEVANQIQFAHVATPMPVYEPAAA